GRNSIPQMPADPDQDQLFPRERRRRNASEESYYTIAAPLEFDTRFPWPPRPTYPDKRHAPCPSPEPVFRSRLASFPSSTSGNAVHQNIRPVPCQCARNTHSATTTTFDRTPAHCDPAQIPEDSAGSRSTRYCLWFPVQNGMPAVAVQLQQRSGSRPGNARG